MEDFEHYLQEVAPALKLASEVDVSDSFARPIEVFDRRVPNRFAIHPMEGWDAEPTGAPSSFTKRRWRRFGQSGASLIWGGEAFAVTANGRANPNQLYRNPDLDGVKELTALRQEIIEGRLEIGGDPDQMVIGLQLTHSGRYSKPTVDGPSPLVPSHHPILDPRLGLDANSPLLTDLQLDQIIVEYVQSAVLARDAGFAFVDVKCCHGYLLHEILGARTRPGPYGGSLDNRTRMLRRIIEGIQAEAPEIGIGVRLSVADFAPHEKGEDGVGRKVDWSSGQPSDFGFGVMSDEGDAVEGDAVEGGVGGLDESISLLRRLMDMGVGVFSISLGSPYHCPHLTRPAAAPPSDGYTPPEDPLRTVARHLQAVRAIKKSLPSAILVGSGYTYLQEFLPFVAHHELSQDHVDFVGLGRMVLSYPELPRDVLGARALSKSKLCRTLSDCTTAPRNGLKSGCYPLDPFYRAQPEAKALRALKRSLRES